MYNYYKVVVVKLLGYITIYYYITAWSELEAQAFSALTLTSANHVYVTNTFDLQ